MNGWRDSMYLVTFGLALVLLMSAVLFVFVGLNPKNEGYSYLPWLYSGISAVGSVTFWVVSDRLGADTRQNRRSGESNSREA